MERILVTGANGQLGSELNVIALERPNYEWVFADRKMITLDELDLLKNQLEGIKPTIIINCGAYTAVDKAEIEEELAFKINHLSVEAIAKYANENNVKLIHISTDYVFDGESSEALDEEAITGPINVYGKSKRAGEVACLKECPNAIIIRTSWVYSKFGNNFVKTMQRLMQEKESISVVNDQIGTPTYAFDLAEAIMSIINHENWVNGIYHYSNEGQISWYEFALIIKELGGYKCDVQGVSSSEYVTPAKRPSFSLLKSEKIKRIYSLEIPDYKESLKKVIK